MNILHGYGHDTCNMFVFYSIVFYYFVRKISCISFKIVSKHAAWRWYDCVETRSMLLLLLLVYIADGVLLETDTYL